MSGYLQRLVLDAMRPGESTSLRSIKPVLGSVFSASRLPVFPEAVQKPEAFEQRDAFEQTEEHVLPRARTEDIAPEPTPVAPGIPVQTTPSTRQRVPDRRDSMAISQRGGSFQPLVATERPASIEKPGLPSADTSDETVRREEPVETFAKREAVDRAMPLPEEAKGLVPYTPLVAGMRRASETAFLNSFETFISGSKRTNKGHPSSRSELPAREPDEVQIHIGRIEVLAVPQAQAGRPAAKPARKSVNLDEYLKRGDKRGG